MKKRPSISLAVFALFAALATMAWGEASVLKPFHGISPGLALEKMDDDFGFNTRLTSPYFLWGRAAISADANLLWRDRRLDSDPAATVQIPYWIFRLGTIGVGAVRGDDIRLYGYGGALVILPDSRYSDSRFLIGGYGGFGFEFLTYATEGLKLYF